MGASALDEAKRREIERFLAKGAWLAAIVGLSRPNLNARLRRLQQDGWIQLKRSRIGVLDADGLRASVTAAGARAGRRD